MRLAMRSTGMMERDAVVAINCEMCRHLKTLSSHTKGYLQEALRARRRGSLTLSWSVSFNPLELVADFLTAFVKLVGFLQVHPEFGASTEELSESESGIGGEVPLPLMI